MKDADSGSLFGVILTQAITPPGYLTFFSQQGETLTVLGKDRVSVADSFLYWVKRGGMRGPEEDMPKARRIIEFFQENVTTPTLPQIRIDNYSTSDPRWEWGGTTELQDGLIIISGGAFGVWLDGPVRDLFQPRRKYTQVQINPQSGYWNRDPSTPSILPTVREPRRIGGVQ